MFETKNNQEYYKIQNVQDLPPFFMMLATSSDVWAFLSSHGALTAGRENSQNALFPYETDDKLHTNTSTGPKTLVRLAGGKIWQPFTTGLDQPYHIERNLFKRNTGDAVYFEEINHDLGLTFSYVWESSQLYGLVRTAVVTNNREESVAFEIVDGVENLIPHGIHPSMAANLSTLADAYKAGEMYGSRLAIYSLTSGMGDTPEPEEVLLANVAWQTDDAATLLSSQQLLPFARGKHLTPETRTAGRKSAFFVHYALELASDEEKSWMMVMDAKKNQKDVIELAQLLESKSADDLRLMVEADVKKGTDELVKIVGMADGLQTTGDATTTTRHYLSTLYNNMRGGVFLDGYHIDPTQFATFVGVHDKGLAQRQAAFLASIVDVKTILELHQRAEQTGDADLIRLSLEFLPLTFSRRHGDPSRPWNQFNVKVKDEDGNRVYAYEGNWRDIFQNWEPIGRSFPAYIAPIITKFLNASTPDGFNPYRINQDGIDWEAPAPHEPFAGLGYWGDHQIVYLNKLLEWLKAYSPQAVEKLLSREIFTYANVPYVIKPYDTFIQDAKNTIVFDFDKHNQIHEHVKSFGTDAKLLMVGDEIYRVSFVEKLMVPILAKLSNFVPGGGIWMNTHRPEWNDANNAIVGNGLSMVTVYQLYRHLTFCRELLAPLAGGTVRLSSEVRDWLVTVAQTVKRSEEFSPRGFLDVVGQAFSEYRGFVYAQGFSGKDELSFDEIDVFLADAIEVLGKTIDANRRPDGMYHAYNILTLGEDDLKVSHLFLMLEGQSAALASGRLSPDAVLDAVVAMEKSDLMNEVLGQFYLYPKKQLSTFMERNIIPAELASQSGLIRRMLDEGHVGFVFKDAAGAIRFHHGIRTSHDVEAQLVAVGATADEAILMREIYEVVFNHKAFTGRSGIMYKFEGIGCIFWHQNGKHLLSVQEAFSAAHSAGLDVTGALKEAYYRLRSGFGFTKTPKVWGAFPLEPYSHTPFMMPAQQPGLTGQAKEDVLLRTTEIGAMVADGILSFNPALLQGDEFISEASVFDYVNNKGELASINLPANGLGFTVCRTPVVYVLGEKNGVSVIGVDGAVLFAQDELSLDAGMSKQVFDGDVAIEKIVVAFSADMLV